MRSISGRWTLREPCSSQGVDLASKGEGRSISCWSGVGAPGYGCEDHSLEVDTIEHSWECLAQLLAGDDTDDILCDVGMPVIHGGVRYNCRIFVLNREILLIRPKLCLANDGNYRETRWFTAWQHPKKVEKFKLPSLVSDVTKQTHVPCDAALEFKDGSPGSETCEELFTPNAPHIQLALSGVEVISNGREPSSASKTQSAR